MMDMYSLLMGGGGSGLPSVSSSDLGAGLCVVKKETVTEGDVIVPEQTVTVSEGWAELQNTAWDDISDGVTCIAVIDGESYTATLDGDWFLAFTDSLGINFAENPPYISELEDGTHTIKVCVASVSYSYEWGIDPYVGYDVVVQMDKSINNPNITDSDIHLIKGSYADCVQKAHSGLPVRSCVYLLYDDESLQECTYISDIAVYENYGDYVDITVYKRGSDIAQYISIYLTESGISLSAP